VAAYFHDATTQLIQYTASYDFDFTDISDSASAMFQNYRKVATLASAQKSEALGFRTTDLSALAAATGQTATETANLKALRDLAAKNLQDSTQPASHH
jgi:hypothetical protein